MLSGLLRRAALCIALGLMALGTPSPSLARASQGPPGTLIDYDSKAGAPAGTQAWRIRYVSHLLEVHHRSRDATSLRWLAQETLYLQHLQKAERELKEHTSAPVPVIEQMEVLVAST